MAVRVMRDSPGRTVCLYDYKLPAFTQLGRHERAAAERATSGLAYETMLPLYTRRATEQERELYRSRHGSQCTNIASRPEVCAAPGSTWVSLSAITRLRQS